ncbi:hypothetical protein [Erythrobacter sp. MTPC3]|uniref:hypothetical protein n=1 Tax=Erythrobacter sp. MTPC3 TaxID=3056564 RepID=UPI0036F38A3A
MTTKNTSNTAPKAKWEAPVVVTAEMDLADIKSTFSAGTDGLIPGGTRSMS